MERCEELKTKWHFNPLHVLTVSHEWIIKYTAELSLSLQHRCKAVLLPTVFKTENLSSGLQKKMKLEQLFICGLN
jgi:hypothetical protein